MAKHIRWIFFILISVKIVYSSGLPQDVDRSRLFFGCSSNIKQSLSECLEKCQNVSCQSQELQNFLSACKSGSKQICTTIIELDPPCNCGIANTATSRRLGGSPTRGTASGGKPSKPTKGNSSKQTRIIGGKEVTPPRKYPWHVRLLILGKILLCGGSIINSRWILTAAHCLVNSESFCIRPLPHLLKVKVGEHRISTISDKDPLNTRIYNVKRYVIENAFKCQPTFNDFARVNDFALVEVTAEIPFNNVIRPVCLPEDDSKTYIGVKATVSGWGQTYEGTPTLFDRSDVLKELEVHIDSQSNCKGWGAVPDSALCTGPLRGRSICIGDSGGPLVVKEGNKYIQVGVVSSVAVNCSTSSPIRSNVYGRVSKVLDWIRKTTESRKC